jgi:hypothetical protein
MTERAASAAAEGEAMTEVRWTEAKRREAGRAQRLTVDGIADDMLKASELDGEAFYVAMKALDARVRAKVSGRAANFLERALAVAEGRGLRGSKTRFEAFLSNKQHVHRFETRASGVPRPAADGKSHRLMFSICRRIWGNSPWVT